MPCVLHGGFTTLSDTTPEQSIRLTGLRTRLGVGAPQPTMPAYRLYMNCNDNIQIFPPISLQRLPVNSIVSVAMNPSWSALRRYLKHRLWMRPG
ncbi:hypothetical protein AWC27_19660 [Mycobacterium szulgai]|uniref:Uncharacterized protein n=1 Tax=Mycobacterium szulgai TaxID=1787 RepID=A0A1X2F713_MYCSZ|nr:hypothetical protein AWC27_19660 [Mycobacterium szulgai]